MEAWSLEGALEAAVLAMDMCWQWLKGIHRIVLNCNVPAAAIVVKAFQAKPNQELEQQGNNGSWPKPMVGVPV